MMMMTMSVCLSVTRVSPVKTDEPIEMPCWGHSIAALIDPRWHTYRRHLANAIERPVFNYATGCCCYYFSNSFAFFHAVTRLQRLAHAQFNLLR